jgi:predicted DsbA family dithiol-disulfide isomerase
LKIEVWADIICPWCGLGNHRLDNALAQFAHRDRLEIHHRSFQLNPAAPVGESMPARQMLHEVAGMSEQRIRTSMSHIEGLAAHEGLAPFHMSDNRVGNTSLAHELLAYATDRGWHVEAWHAMFDAYFARTADIFTVDGLVGLAQDWGLDPEEARDALESRRYRGRVDADAREAVRLGASGVPFFVVDGRYQLPGALPSSELLAALDRARNEPHPVQKDERRSGAVEPPNGAPHRPRKEALPANIAQAIAWGVDVAIVAEWLDGADDVGSNPPDA